MSMEEESLTIRAAEVAKAQDQGIDMAFTVAQLKAEASQHDEQTRHRLAEQAREELLELGATGMRTLLTIFQIASLA